MAGIRSLFIVFFLTVLYGCGAEDQKPADATPSVAGTSPPVAFEHSMLNGTWTSTCAQGGLDAIPNAWVKFVLTFDNGVLSGGYNFFENINTDPDTACNGDPSGFFDISAEYTVDISDQIIEGLRPYEIDIVGNPDGIETTWLNIIYIDGNTFQWGELPTWSTVRPTVFDRQFLFRRN